MHRRTVAAETFAIMIKQASGDWQRRIPPWATTHICDLRRYRGPYTDAREELVRKGRAINRLYAALAQASREGVEFLIVRFGERSPRRSAIHRLLRDFVCSPEHADSVNIG